MIDPERVFVGLALVLFLAAGFDLGIAFLTRGEKEASREVYEVKDR